MIQSLNKTSGHENLFHWSNNLSWSSPFTPLLNRISELSRRNFPRELQFPSFARCAIRSLLMLFSYFSHSIHVHTSFIDKFPSKLSLRDIIPSRLPFVHVSTAALLTARQEQADDFVVERDVDVKGKEKRFFSWIYKNSHRIDVIIFHSLFLISNFDSTFRQCAPEKCR